MTHPPFSQEVARQALEALRSLLSRCSVSNDGRAEAEIAIASLSAALADKEAGEPRKLWLWRNHVDGRPEYWAFDHPFPTNMDNADPQTIGEPCGYAIFKPSRDGSNGRTEEKVLRGIAGAILHRSSEEAHASLREWAKRTVASPDAAAGEKL